MGGGSQVTDQYRGQYYVASMRPRQGGRGESTWMTNPRLMRSCFNEAAPRWARRDAALVRAPAEEVASMRPRHDGRGEAEPAGSAAPAPCGFNEAAPRWARRVSFRTILFAESMGFNEAAPRWARRAVTETYQVTTNNLLQ